MIVRIAVTGGSGKAGRAVVRRLAEAGFDVTNLDVAASPDPDAPTLIVDLAEPGQAMEALAGFDAVVHLAAIPAPNVVPDAATFAVNTMSTYHVFSAACRLALQKVVWASSETLIGLPFRTEPPRYAPIDEDHPRLPESHYALSKLVGEELATQFARWHGIPHIGLRFSNIMEEPDYRRFPAFWDDPALRSWNLWGYVDARDVARAVEAALTVDVIGAEVFLVAAADTCMTQPSAELMAAVYPQVPLRRPVDGHETLLAIDKATSMLGYRPAHSWRDHVEA